MLQQQRESRTDERVRRGTVSTLTEHVPAVATKKQRAETVKKSEGEGEFIVIDKNASAG